MTQYYIHHDDGSPEGPFDLPSLLRKARAGKLHPYTLLSTTENSQQWPASEYEELVPLLGSSPHAPGQKSDNTNNDDKVESAGKRIIHALKTGWKFCGNRPIVFVVSSAVVMGSFGIGTLFSGIFPWQGGLAVSLVLYFIFQHLFMAIIQRYYRGQYLDAKFIKFNLLPIMLPLLVATFIILLLGTLGLAALLLPGILLFTLTCFVPYVMADKKADMFQAFRRSALLSMNDGLEGFGAVMALTTLNLLSLVLIITLPLSLPVLAVAYAELYDKLSS